ncbi:MAG TPA: LrgB family protein [Lachnospiraceae bacterium]|nr:LrgB family protein [Lachnospiraceae bacterium]HPF29574.1 LrgB family protein [Lachnospiraceae bacterium]
MNDFFQNSVFVGVTISLLAYMAGDWLRKKWKIALINPLLISIIVTILVLLAGKVEYDIYMEGAQYLSWLLTPATICLAIPLYEKWELLKKNRKAVIAGLVSGVSISLVTNLVLAILFELTHEEYVTLIPKSVTVAIGIGLCEELGGYVTITIAVIVITGVLGNIIAEPVLKLFRITEPVAKGIAIGTSCHAMGTAKAMEIGEIEGAMSSLSIAVAGILTVVASIVFTYFR